MTTASDTHAICRHVSCVGCGYDLFGASISAHCPECGKPASETLERTAWMAEQSRLDALRSSLTPWIIEAVMSGLIVLAALGVVFTVDRTAFGVLAATGQTLICLAATVAGFLSSTHFARCLAGIPDFASRLKVVRRLDVVACVGLWLLVTTAWLVVRSGTEASTTTLAIGWTAFLLLTIATARLHLAYRLRASVASALALGNTGRQLIILGVTKSVFEATWLGVCIVVPGLLGMVVWLIDVLQLGDLVWGRFVQLESAVGGVAIALLTGALLGIPVYGLIWIAMIVTHSVFATRVHRAVEAIRIPVGSGKSVDE